MAEAARLVDPNLKRSTVNSIIRTFRSLLHFVNTVYSVICLELTEKPIVVAVAVC